MIRSGKKKKKKKLLCIQRDFSLFFFASCLKFASDIKMRLDQRKLQQTNGGVLVVFPPRLGASARKPHRFCTTSFHVITQSRSNLGIICRFPEASKNTLVSPLARVFAAIVSEAEPLMSAPRYAGLIHGPLLPLSAFSPLCVGDKPLPSRETQRH